MAKRFIGGDVVSDVAPAGSVTAFAGDVPPDGWLLCQGQELNIADYPALYAAIGTTWNTQTNPTSGSAYSAPAAGKFRLPDFRGSFLRGAGSPHAGDTCTVGGHQSQKTAKNGLSNSTSSVSGTANGAGGHSHSSGTLKAQRSKAGGADNIGGRASSKNNQSTTYNDINISGSTGGVANHTHSLSATASAQAISGDNETRPLNQGVNYIVKY